MNNVKYDPRDGTVTVTDPRTPLWQRLTGLSDPIERDGWDVTAQASVLIGVVVMAMLRSGVLVVALLALFVVMLAYKKARLSVSANRNVTVWSPNHVADLRVLAETPACTDLTMWEAALSHREARFRVSRCS